MCLSILVGQSFSSAPEQYQQHQKNGISLSIVVVKHTFRNSSRLILFCNYYSSSQLCHVTTKI